MHEYQIALRVVVSPPKMVLELPRLEQPLFAKYRHIRARADIAVDSIVRFLQVLFEKNHRGKTLMLLSAVLHGALELVYSLAGVFRLIILEVNSFLEKLVFGLISFCRISPAKINRLLLHSCIHQY